ncbi:MAG: hypothetical protein M3R17_05550 [Bacteroidota bacterium]|nr:hypothetical protein [Bacteroidota bacterium]
MNKFLLLVSLVLAFLANGLSAQNAGGSPKGKPDTAQTASGSERVQALKVAFITERLDLTPAEAEKFWPVYNEYQDKREAVRRQLQADYKIIREQADQLTPEELTRIADEEVSLKAKDAALVSEMHEKLKKILPPKKLAQLYVAEEDFKRRLVEILTEDNQTKGPRGPKGPK